MAYLSGHAVAVALGGMALEVFEEVEVALVLRAAPDQIRAFLPFCKEAPSQARVVHTQLQLERAVLWPPFPLPFSSTLV